MKRSIPLFALLAITPLGANAAQILAFGEEVTPDVIFGTGNANGAFTVDRNNDVELGLRAKLRHNDEGEPEDTFNSNGDGTYSFAVGVAPTQTHPTAVWSFEWSINSAWAGQSGHVLSDLSYEFGIDSDPGLDTEFFRFDPINVPLADHAIGTNATGNGGGTVATNKTEYGQLIGKHNVAQNSSKAHWGIEDFDPTVDGVYDIYLSASDHDSDGNELARTNIQVIVGDGATATVPVPAPLALFGLGLLALGFVHTRSRAV